MELKKYVKYGTDRMGDVGRYGIFAVLAVSNISCASYVRDYFEAYREIWTLEAGLAFGTSTREHSELLDKLNHEDILKE
jgi:hypothetical protein